MAKALLLAEKANTVDFTPVAAVSAGDIVQLPSGRAGIVKTDLAAAQKGSAFVDGTFTMAKTTSVVFLEGQKLFYVKSTGKLSYTGDFFVGVAAADAASAATTCTVFLNVIQRPVIDLRQGEWPMVNSTATTTVTPGGAVTLALTTAGSAQHAWITSEKTVPLGDGPIVEAWINYATAGDNAVVDVDWGLVNAAGTTDFEAVTDLVSFHLDGASLNINVQSDDGTTDTAAVDTTIDIVAGTPIFCQIDLRTTTPKFYVNGVLCTSTATTLAGMSSTGTLKAAVCIEKSGTDDSPGTVTVQDFIVRTKASL